MQRKLKIILGIALLAPSLFAQTASAQPSYRDILFLTCENIPDCVRLLFDYIITLAFPVAVIFIIWSGFLFISAGGNEEKLTTAKKTFFWTIIGLAIVIAAWLLSVAFQEFFINL